MFLHDIFGFLHGLFLLQYPRLILYWSGHFKLVIYNNKMSRKNMEFILSDRLLNHTTISAIHSSNMLHIPFTPSPLSSPTTKVVESTSVKKHLAFTSGFKLHRTTTLVYVLLTSLFVWSSTLSRPTTSSSSLSLSFDSGFYFFECTVVEVVLPIEYSLSASEFLPSSLLELVYDLMEPFSSPNSLLHTQTLDCIFQESSLSFRRCSFSLTLRCWLALHII